MLCPRLAFGLAHERAVCQFHLGTGIYAVGIVFGIQHLTLFIQAQQQGLFALLYLPNQTLRQQAHDGLLCHHLLPHRACPHSLAAHRHVQAVLFLFEHVFHVFFDAGVLGFDGFHPFRVFGFARRRQGTQFFACVVLYRPLAIHMQAQHKSALAIRQTQAAVRIHAKRRHHIVGDLLVCPLMPFLILGNGGARQGADVIA